MDVPAFAQVSDEDIALIIQLLKQDGEDIVSATIGKGKQPEGTMTDTQAAFNLFMRELQDAETFFADRRMTRSIQSAIQIDGDTIVQSQNEEAVAEHDRNLSVSLSNDESEPPVPQSASLPSAHDDELMEKMACIYITGIDDTESDDDTIAASQPEGSAWAASRQVGKTRQRRSCEACGEPKHFAALSRAPCQHEYCRQCLSRLFQDAMVDESLFPPRCCKQPIPLDKSQLFLDANVARQFRQKAVELATPNRTYCHNTDCAAFIPPANCRHTTATCGECRGQTCTACKGAWHAGDCPNDEQLQQVIRLAREQGWQRCQNCWGMVELNTGCNHMTCRCGFQFCYVCGTRWKACGCDHWAEHRLYERAAQIDARDQAGAEAIPPGLDLMIREERPREIEELPRETEEQRDLNWQRRIRLIAEDLRENHECVHEHWSSRSGRQRCEECHDVMPIFIYECRQCHIMACRYCRYHRL
ncbi:putative IBR finger domain protein [Rosellinia necatrix]|uniref:RBR-type E3 ubiquitin transferase n=1 Tax=Rosellinia necatrix TaxID=77044 RepID=A0A1W2TMA7_ROSNE|nr:putative IBR finger domain protein [Rosellinia necatrix]